MGEKPTEQDEGEEESRSPNFPVPNTTVNRSDEAAGTGQAASDPVPGVDVKLGSNPKPTK